MPANTLFTGSFRMTLPSGVRLNVPATRLASDLASRLTLIITANLDGSWLFTISSGSSLRSGSDMVYRNVVEIVYTVDETVAKGKYEAVISNLSFAFTDNTKITADKLPVTITVSTTTGIPAFSAEPSACISNGQLYVTGPVAETVEVYTITGTLLYKFRKPEGETVYPVENLNRSILIVKGSSGWVKKAVNN